MGPWPLATTSACIAGNRLREPGRGHADKFSCLFHGWEYGIDGELIKALDPECFPQGIDARKLSLQPVLCETWAGFVFICLDPNAGPLKEYLGVIPQHLDPYHFEDWNVTYDCTIEIECNWKTSVDAFNEAYHLSSTHAWTIEFSDDVNTVYDCYDKHTRMIFPELQASPRHPGAGTVTPMIKEMFLKRVGVDVDAFEGGPADARRAYADQIRAIAPALGADVSELNESQLCDDFHYTVFPNMTFNTHSLFTWIFLHRPHPTDPNKMFFDFINLSNTPNQEPPRPSKEFYRTADGDTLNGKCEGGDLLDEDLYNLPRIQAGNAIRCISGPPSRSAGSPHLASPPNPRGISRTGILAWAVGEWPRLTDRSNELLMSDPNANEWVDVPIPLPPDGETATFALGGVELLLCNASGTAYVVKDECPHVQTSMRGGLIRGTILECPLHGGQMDLRDGSPVAMPIRRPGVCYGVRKTEDGWQVAMPVSGSSGLDGRAEDRESNG